MTSALPPQILYPVYDCPWSNVADLPSDARWLGGYTTGSEDVRWHNFNAFPDAMKVDQSSISGVWDAFADWQDYEKMAVLLNEIPSRVKAMQHAFKNGLRPGQREAGVYVGAPANATPVVNTLIASGIDKGVFLAEAIPGMAVEAAVSRILNSVGTPWPIVWIQTAFGQKFDTGVVYRPWWENVSKKPLPKLQIDNIKNITASQGRGEINLDIRMEDGSAKPYSITIPSWTWHS